MQRLKTLFLQFLFIVVALEIILHVYNPLNNRYKNGQLVLPANTTYTIANTDILQLDSVIIHTKNKYGFRGSNFDKSNSNKVVCIGGSTTECFYLSDGNDWVSLLRLNPKAQVLNAGLDGHTTFGHQYLYKHHIKQLKPDIIILMVGANDMFVKKMSKFDAFMLPKKGENFITKTAKNSKLLSAINTIINAKKAEVVKHKSLDLNKKLSIDTVQLQEDINELKPFLKNYKVRLTKLVQSIQKNKTKVVILTQPTLCKGMTGFDARQLDLGSGWNGERFYQSLKLYNNISRTVAAEKKIKLIDLAHKMDGNPLWFYDQVHFTNQGARKVAELINAEKF